MMTAEKEYMLIALGTQLVPDHPYLANMPRATILALTELYYDAGVKSVIGEPETVDLMVSKPNGEVTLIGKVKIPELMKAKEIITQMFGHGDFDDDMGDHCLYLAMFEQFIEWQKEQAKHTGAVYL